MWSGNRILALHLDKVDCGIQVNPGDDLNEATVTNINVKLSSENQMKVSNKSSPSRHWLIGEHQEKQNVNVDIEITPDTLDPIIHIKFNMMEMTIKKYKHSEEPMDERKRKCNKQ